MRQPLGTVEVMEATPGWARRDDGWWAAVGAVLALVTGIVTAVAARRDVAENGTLSPSTLVRTLVIAVSVLCAAVLLARRR